jgi:hypothetical protein
MTNEHPITPPPELVHQWVDMLSSRSDQAVFTMAAQWGADQELQSTLGLMATLNIRGVDYVRNARRPKPPSLKEQALKVLESAPLNADEHALIRRALEALDD